MKITTVATLTYDQLRSVVWNHMIESLSQEELGDTGDETLKFVINGAGEVEAVIELSRGRKQ